MTKTEQQIVSEATRESKSTGTRRVIVAMVVLFVLSLIIAITAAVTAYRAQHHQAVQATDLAQQVQTACDRNPSSLPENIRQLCGKADKVVDQAPTTVTGKTGPRGPAPSSAQVSSAVALYCSAHRDCRGANGVGPSPTQVASAVRTYCNARGKCKGGKGDSVTGDKGDKGDKGDTGLQGPGPSDDQVLAGVRTYCDNHNGCKGDNGANGTNGTDGVSVTGVDCTAGTGTFTFTFSNGTTKEVTCPVVSPPGALNGARKK